MYQAPHWSHLYLIPSCASCAYLLLKLQNVFPIFTYLHSVSWNVGVGFHIFWDFLIFNITEVSILMYLSEGLTQIFIHSMTDRLFRGISDIEYIGGLYQLKMSYHNFSQFLISDCWQHYQDNLFFINIFIFFVHFLCCKFVHKLVNKVQCLQYASSQHV